MSQPDCFAARSPTPPEISTRFADGRPPLTRQAALLESDRCLFCFDAPCMGACPTHIDVPRFIRKIQTGNLGGSARTILEANILGASCSRACPVEILCEGACVLHRYNREPIQIGLLQRHAMDSFHQSGTALPFVPAPDTDQSVALLGAGPASLACAAELRRAGHAATVYDARPLPGGLNTYGIAEYKLPLQESLREISMIARLGVRFEFGRTVDAAGFAHLQLTHDAVFLGLGLGGIARLGLVGEDRAGVTDALALIAGYKDGTVTSMPPSVAVIGAGNTAIDAAIASKRLGAAEVYLIYRRGPEDMSAFAFEYEHAKHEGIRFLWHMQPVALRGDPVSELELAALEAAADGTFRARPGSAWTLPIDRLVLAIGQLPHTQMLAGSAVQLERGRVVIDRATGQTADPRVFAGGDCSNGGREVVDAVADGKRAGLGMVAYLSSLAAAGTRTIAAAQPSGAGAMP